MNSVTLPYKQSGAALLAFVLILITGTSYLLLNKLNSNLIKVSGEERTRVALNQAKQALIGYAVTYPDDVNPNMGPGYLPCPDNDNDGNAEGSCAFGGPSNYTIGRFPYKRLEMEELRDAHGERLWYAIAQNFRNNPKLEPLNSETSADLSVNGASDIVAVIIAPGPPLSSQNRDRSETDITTEIANYLEDDNADLDVSYVTFSSSDINDQVVFITRQELMQAVEKRVLGEVVQTLRKYQSEYDAYPWLSPFVDPNNSTFHAQLDTSTTPKRGWQGHLPFHWADDPLSITNDPVNGISGRNPFDTDFTIQWTISNANAPDPPPSDYDPDPPPYLEINYDNYDGATITPPTACIENTLCTDVKYPELNITSPITFSDADCAWTNKEEFQCTATHEVTSSVTYPEATIPAFSANTSGGGTNQWVYISSDVTAYRGECAGSYIFGFCWDDMKIYPYTETVIRTYIIDITFTDNTADGADIIPPTTTSFRTRNLELIDDGSALKSGGTTSVSITIEDKRSIEVTEPGGDTTYSSIANRILTNDSDTTGTITVSGIHYDIDIDDDLPEWFVKNDWHKLIYVAYPEAETLPGSSTSVCAVGGDCLVLNGAGSPDKSNRALAIIAGDILTGQDRATAPTVADYYEMGNAINTSPDHEIFDKAPITSTFNDQVKVLAVPP